MRCPAIWSEVRSARRVSRARRRAADRRAARKSSGGRPPSAAFHIHLWPMAQMLRGTCAGSVMPQSTAATMSQCSSAVTKRVALVGIVAQPVQQLGEAPLATNRRRRTSRSPPACCACAAAVISAASFRRGGRTRGSSRRAARASRRPGSRSSRWCRARWPRSLRRRCRLLRWRARVAAASARHVIGVDLRGVVRDRPACGCSGYSATPDAEQPASLSTIETRTLSVPKSTPRRCSW